MGPARRPDFASFVRVARLLNSSLDLDEVLRDLLAGLDRLLEPANWSLLLREEGGDGLIFRLVRNPADRALLGMRVEPGEGVAGWVVQNQRSLVIPDVARDPRFASRFDRVSGVATRSLLAVPLRTEERVIGVLELVNALEDRAFTPEDLEILEAFADFAAVAIENARAHGALLEASRTDPLSGLRNSSFFLSCVEQAAAHGEPFALLFFDMDRFKALVDEHGHMSGSAALAEVGRVLAGALEPGEVGCRFGGDEFAVLLPGADGARAEERSAALAARIRERTFLEERLRVRLDASFGWSAFPDDAASATVLLQVADDRMYAAKRRRKRARGSA